VIGFEAVSVVFGGRVRALDQVSLAVGKGEIVGVVGESGSGKTTLCRVLMGLEAATSGRVLVDGEAVGALLARDRLGFRRRAQMVLQDAAASLSPRMRVRDLVDEPRRIHRLPADGRVARLMGRLGLPESVLDKYPHQISGGQGRRVAILRALVLQPDILVADEPTAGLDVSVQGELLNVMAELHRDLGLTYLIVSHNLNVVRQVTGRTVVMYLGEIVEDAATAALFAAPRHPYSAALLSTNPAVDPARRRKRIILEGEIPSPVNPPSGCRFHTRCPFVQARCREERPALVAGVRCHFPLG
jgi:peptide/nickel transport system ATP-binding protein